MCLATGETRSPNAQAVRRRAPFSSRAYCEPPTEEQLEGPAMRVGEKGKHRK